jgi:predicted RecB family nuclease
LDAAEKKRGKSALGSFHYIPVLFIHREKVKKEEKLLLAFLAYVLGKRQGRYPEFGKIIYGQQFQVSKVRPHPLEHKVRTILGQIRGFKDKKKQPQLILNDHCQVCEFRNHCEKEALAKDDLSLLRGMKEKDIQAHNSRGIFTVTQLSHTFRPRRRRKRAKHAQSRRYHALQALAIREQKVIVYGEPELPTSPVSIYLDIEGDLDQSHIYLIGLIIEKDAQKRIYSFWAENARDQTTILDNFLATIEEYDDFILYHYGSYESRFLKRISRIYDGKYRTCLNGLLKHSVNVLSLIYENFYFPVYYNSLKSIAKYLSYEWSESNMTGIDSFIMRKRWERNQNENLKRRLIRYNLEDCVALKKTLQFLHRISEPNRNNDQGLEDTNVAYPNDLQRYDKRTFKKNNFQVKELDFVNDCAYFDYQREKVYIRTRKITKPQSKKTPTRKNLLNKVNKVIEFDRIDECPRCGGKKIRRNGFYERLRVDLRFLRTGVKRWLVKYRSPRLQCTKCKKNYTPKIPGERHKCKFGTNLINWVVYENTVKGVSFRKIQENLEEVFDLSITPTMLHKFKYYAADYYQDTYRKICDKIFCHSQIIHADETSVKLRDDNGYVWVFTNGEEVAFQYRPTREGEFLKELLKNFNGVLISDYYGAYDSLKCVQQKCLIHLIRDLNEDLRKHPFDQEYKEMVQKFGALLKNIVETIDRYGLKRRFLNKHNKEVERFYKWLFKENRSSETMNKYIKRFKKNEEKLFSFLNYEGVPWNNNNAEHALKHFAVYRRRVNGTFSEKGLGAYLVLLSIYKTCKYKNLSFHKFLLSQESENPIRVF